MNKTFENIKGEHGDHHEMMPRDFQCILVDKFCVKKWSVLRWAAVFSPKFCMTWILKPWMFKSERLDFKS